MALDCLKTCLSDFIGHNIELISNFIEACGPFMAKNLDSEISTRFNSLLDMTWRLKEKESLPQLQVNNLEEAYYLCRPKKNQRGLH